MIKIKRKTLLIIFLLLLISTFTQVCFADSNEEIKKNIENNVDENLNKIDLNELETWINSLDSLSSLVGEDIKSALKEIIKGDYKGSVSDVFSLITNEFNRKLYSLFPIMVSIIAICLLHSIISGMSSDFLSTGIKEIIFFVCYCAIVVLISTEISKIVKESKNTILAMQSLMNIVFPILLTMIVAIGGITTSSVYQPLMVTLSTTVANIITKFIFPCFIITTILALVGNISKNIKLGKLEKFLKSTSTYIIGVIFSLFITFLSYQGLTGGIADTVFIKGAKFALQSYIPVLGGYLSDGFDLMLASIVLIKNSLGLVTTIALLSLVLMPMIKILFFSLTLKLLSGIVEPFADSRFSMVLEDSSKNLSIILTSILGIAFMFFIVVMMIIYTCNLGVI